MVAFARRHLSVVSLFGWLCLIFSFGCDDVTPMISGVDDAIPPLTVYADPIGQNSPPQKTSVVFGRLRPEERVQLRFPRPGQIATVDASVGDVVSKGDVLATLEQENLKAQAESLTQRLGELNKGVSQSSPQQQQAIQKQTEQLQRQLGEIEAQRQALTLVAPIDGLIWKSNLRVGDVANPANSTMQVVSNQQPTIALAFDKDEVDMLAQSPVFWVSLGSEILQAKLIEPIDQISGSMTATLKFESEIPADLWHFDDVCEVRFRQAYRNDGFWIPLEAITSSADGFQVLAVISEADGSRLSAREVQVQEVDSDQALVTGNLQSGDLIVSSGGHRVVAGQRVSVRLKSAAGSQVESPQ